MKRDNLINLLEEYSSSIPEEIEFKKHMLSFIKQHKDCFERSLEVGHITASAWVLNKDHSKALLMHHAKLDRWFQLGGHCDGDHDVLRVAIKEAQEEAGVKCIAPISDAIFDIDIHLIPENKREKAHYHYDVRFLLAMTEKVEVVQNCESKGLQWIGKNLAELPTDNASVVRMFNKWLARASK